MKLTLYILLISLLISQSLKAQDSTALMAFENHLELAKGYDQFSFYAECIDEINAALEIVREQDWNEKEVILIIFLSEVKRKTNSHDEGLSLLYNLKNSKDYPKLHIRKLGRIAALYNEMPDVVDIIGNRDSVFKYLDSALHISVLMGLKNAQAGLYNELGYTLGAVNVDSSLFYLNKAAHLFATLKDTANYVVALTNIMRTHTLQNDYEKVEPIIDEILKLIQLSNWNSLGVKLEFYRTLTYYYFRIEDSLKFNYWNVEKYRTIAEILKTSNSSKLNSFRALYETNKYKEEATKKAEELLEVSDRRKDLLKYITVSVGIILLIAFLLLRERKLKKQVNKVNEKYHMLIVESNHRIKNNLQMIISMLDYSSKDLIDKDSHAFKRISGKIQTISALHKHLYVDVHNEKVDMKTYFEEIISLYHDISNGTFKINLAIGKIALQSERIVYFGLIFNEMISNTIEHSNASSKTINITTIQLDDRFQLVYQDYSSFELSKNGTGIDLIEQLVKRIEGINFKFDGELGKYQFEFYV